MLIMFERSRSSEETTVSFLREWSTRKLAAYGEEYGGQRAGVPKGEEIPFPCHKVQAAIALLAYGAPDYKDLTAIAREVGVSSALLRVWRTEERFLALYRRAVWECADDYLYLLAKGWEEKRPSPSEEFQKHFGVALQRAIMQHLLTDVTHILSEWNPPRMSSKWRSEWKLIDPPPKQAPTFSNDSISLLIHNAHELLSSTLLRLGTREPAFERWAYMMTDHDFITEHLLKKDLKAAAEKYGCKEVITLIDFITRRSAINRYLTLFQLLDSGKKARRSR